MRRVIPGILYLFLFLALTFPSITYFSTRVLCGEGDGLQNLWNLWWFHLAVVRLHQSPWFTHYLHFPHGTSLIGHTLNPFNGVLGLVFLPWFSLAMTYNIVLIGSFVATGWTTYLLARRLNIECEGSLLAGAIVTFSSYHFAHAQGQLQLISFEWVPIFFLFWTSMLVQPRLRYAVAAAVSLFLVLQCDYYYTLYSILGAAVLTFSAYVDMPRPREWRPYTSTLALFILLTIVLCGPFVWALHHVASEGPLWGIHQADVNSLDLLGPFIPGGHWRFAAITQPIWSRWSSNIYENSAYLGWSVIVLVVMAWRHRAAIPISFLKGWFSLMLLFFVLALGPFLHVGGHEFRHFALPYRGLEIVLPLLSISGNPIRMISMVVLAVGLMAGAGFSYWLKSGPKKMMVMFVLIFMTFEYLPVPIPATRLKVPAYIQVLAAAPPGALIDPLSSQTWTLFYQTVHGKPLGLGYISRVPASVQAADNVLIALYQHGEFQLLRDRYGFRYVLLPANDPIRKLIRSFKTLYDDGSTLLIDLAGK